MSEHLYSSSAAGTDFRRARQRAVIRDMIGRLTGQTNDLLSFDEVRQKLRVGFGSKRELRDIPLDAIVGSVGRYSDFTRDFLPRSRSAQDRWVRVKRAMNSMEGVPPIEVYQVGDAYFVLDGNHRVSVAREDGAMHIQAYVTVMQTHVPLTPDITPDDLIIRAEYADFLDRTQFYAVRRDADLTVTVPGQYLAIEAQIAQHQATLKQASERDVPLADAVANWYDHVYTPVVQVIRERGILDDFPDRTETDLYLWTVEHRTELEQALGWPLDLDAVASDLASQRSEHPRRVLARLGERLHGALVPSVLEPGPAPGAWRTDRRLNRDADRVINDILVPINGESVGWRGLEQAAVIAQREGARLVGLHVVPDNVQRERIDAQAIRIEFLRRCGELGVQGSAVVEAGSVTEEICGRARWTDLIVLSLSYPPGTQPLARLQSGFRALVQQCSRPIMAVPDAPTRLQSALLPFDGSAKATEALYAAAYLAGRWNTRLTVITVQEAGATNADTIQHARQYLESRNVTATYLIESGSVAEAILRAADADDSDLIVIGGYGFTPVLAIALGSTVDQVLRASRRPVLICR